MPSPDRTNRPISNAEKEHRARQSAEDKRHKELLSLDDIQNEYRSPTKRWLELAALSGDGPPMVKLSARMVRYHRGDFEDWLKSRTVRSTSEQFDAQREAV